MKLLKLLILLTAIMVVMPQPAMMFVSAPDALPAAKAPAPIKSTFFVQVNVSKATIHEKLEAAIPLEYNGVGHGKFGDMIPTSYDTKFKINREAIKLDLGENRISVATRLSGSGNAVVEKKVLRPRISVTMDVVANIGIDSVVKLKPDWTILSTTTTSLNVSKASTKILGIPVSAIDDLEEAMQPKMDDLKNKVTKALDAIDVRKPVEKAWKNMGKAVAIDKSKSGWLTVNPTGLYYSGFTQTNDGIKAVIGVDAVIEGAYGPKPADTDAKALPPFKTIAPSTEGFNINFPVFASYEYLRESLQKEAVGKVFELDRGVKVEIEAANLYSNGERIVVALDIVAKLPDKWLNTSGRIYFSGKPVFDAKTNRLFMQGFDYDLKTKDYLMKVANGLFHESLRNNIARKLSWNLSSRLQEAKSKANKKLAHVSLKNGASLSGSVGAMRVNGVFPLEKGIQIGAVFKGNMSVAFQ